MIISATDDLNTGDLVEWTRIQPNALSPEERHGVGWVVSVSRVEIVLEAVSFLQQKQGRFRFRPGEVILRTLP